jgi:hypothetical protein
MSKNLSHGLTPKAKHRFVKDVMAQTVSTHKSVLIFLAKYAKPL